MRIRLKPLLLWFPMMLLLVSFSQAQVNITGTVKSKKGEPIAGASITVRETAQGTTTSESGEFRIALSTPRTITLDISFVGYASQSVSVNPEAASAPMVIILEEGTNTMGDVILTASSSRRVQQVMPMSVTSFTATKLAKVKFNSQADILRSVPGITAEGGGGELASNIFVRGLPSGGQYQFTPLQIDGMPVVSTMGLNSSAPDVYFRNDLGIQRMDFVRGGSATMWGMGSVAGIINYTSRVGGAKQQTLLETELASPGKLRLDFNTGGPLADKVSYNISGTYRYDEGPVVTGLSSNGYQLRGNIRKELNNGSFTLYGQLIDDRVQFFLPYHLTSNRKRPTGWDGKTIMTMQTGDVSNLTVRTPNGYYRSKAAGGVATKGGYLMAAFEKEFTSGWKMDARIRSARYQHQFNFFGVDGSGRNPMTQRIFIDSVAARPPQVPVNVLYTYANDNTPLNPASLVLENNMTDRDRPLNEMAANFNISRTFRGQNATHTLNFGSFLARTEAGDYNVQIRYLSEFKNQPRILNLKYTDNGVVKNYTTGGVRAVPGYTNKWLTSIKKAFYLTDEMVLGKFRVDLGLRIESIHGTVNAEKTATTTNADGLSVAWGTGSYDKFNVHASDWAAALGTSYQLKKNLNVYANFSRGYFFPELRGARVTYVGGLPAYPVYKPERILQGEAGLKYSKGKGIATLALFTNKLNDRLNVVFLNVNNAVQEVANLLSSQTSGLEATFDWELIRNVRIDGALTFQKHKYTKDDATPANVGKWLERQPRFMYNIGATYAKGGFDVGYHTEYFGKRFGNPSNLVTLDPYSIARFDMGYTFQLKEDGNLRLAAGVFNLFNNEGITEGNPRAGNTQTNTGDFFVGRPIIPRSFFARATYTF